MQKRVQAVIGDAIAFTLDDAQVLGISVPHALIQMERRHKAAQRGAFYQNRVEGCRCAQRAVWIL